MPLPQGGYAQPDEQRELFAWEAQEFSFITIELGIDWAPIIEWKEGLTNNEGNTFSRYECEMVLHRLATQFGFSFVQVTEAPNNTAIVWTPEPDREGKYHQDLWQADYHVTTMFGFGPDHCSVHGHIYLARDDTGQ